MSAELSSWQTVAINLPEHADNPIHTDAGAQAAGFERALVAGVSTYALLTHVPTLGWGRPWLSGGGGRVRFRRPVFDQDLVLCSVDENSATDNAAVVNAVVKAVVNATVDDEERASLELFSDRPDLAASTRERHDQSGRPVLDESLEAVERLLDERWATYGSRLGSDATVNIDSSLIHPAAWLAFANNVFHTQLVDGPWIHTGSLFAHHRLAHVGESIAVETKVVDRFSSKIGERAIADVQIVGEHGLVARIEHEAVIKVA